MIPPVWGQAVIAGKSASHWSTIWDEMYVGDSTNLIIHCIIYKFEIIVAHECTPLKILNPITWKTNTEISTAAAVPQITSWHVFMVTPRKSIFSHTPALEFFRPGAQASLPPWLILEYSILCDTMWLCKRRRDTTWSIDGITMNVLSHVPFPDRAE